MLDVLNSDKAREHMNNTWALDPKWNTHPFNPKNPDKNALLRQWLNYDLNPWGARKATDIPIDLERGRLVQAARLKGKGIESYIPPTRSGSELEDMVSGVDYNSAINEAESGRAVKPYTDKIVKSLEDWRDTYDANSPQRRKITRMLEEDPINEWIAEDAENMNPAFPVDAHIINPAKFSQNDYTYYRVAPHVETEYLDSVYKREDIAKARGTGELLFRPGMKAIGDFFYTPIIDIDDEHLIKIHRPKIKY